MRCVSILMAVAPFFINRMWALVDVFALCQKRTFATWFKPIEWEKLLHI